MTGEASPDTRNDGLPDAIEELVARCVTRFQTEGEPGIVAEIREHPEHAETLRRRIEGLKQLGLLQTEAEAADEPGILAERYRLDRLLGHGGQGDVWLAHDQKFGRRVAIKLLHRHAALSATGRRRFEREAALASKLDDPGICTVHEAGFHDATPFIVMRFVEGHSLARVLDEAKTPADPAAPHRTSATRAEQRRLIGIVESAARALHIAHEAGVVHRDVKPGNIMVTPEDQPVILDFGLARDLGDTPESLTMTGDVFGTPSYMAPEQVRGSRSSDRRTDVYALGAVLFETLTGRPPFVAESREELFRAILDAPLPGARRLNPAISRDLEVCVSTALARESSLRYATALAFADDLRAILDHRPIQARPPSWPGRAARWVRRRPEKAALGAGLVILAFVAGLVAFHWDDFRRGSLETRLEREQDALQDAFLELGHGTASRAIRVFRNLIAENPALTEAFAGLAMAHLEVDQADEALRVLDQAPLTAGETAGLAAIRADAMRAKDPKSPADEAAIPSSHLDHFILGFRDLARAQRGRKNAYKTAFEHFSKAIARSPRARQLYYFEQARAAANALDKAAAAECSDSIVALWPGSAVARYYAGLCLNKTDVNAAITQLEASLTIRRRHQTLNTLGLLVKGRGEVERAIDHFKEGARLAPDSVTPRYNLGVQLLNLGRHEEAVAAFENALSIDSELAEAQAMLGYAHFMCGRFDEAVVQLRRADAKSLPARRQPLPIKVTIGDVEKAKSRLPALEFLARGGPPPVDDEEQFALARVAFLTRRPELSARLYAEARDGAGPDTQPRISEAVCAAACAGCGDGTDATSLSGPAREAWRRQALAWINLELEAILAKAPGEGPPAILAAAAWWRRDPHLQPFQTGTALETWSAAERASWTAFWDRVDAEETRARNATDSGVEKR